MKSGTEIKCNKKVRGYVKNSILIKSNWTLEQLNWKLYQACDMAEYDGLTKLFVKLTENNLELFEDAYIKRWYKLSTDLKID